MSPFWRRVALAYGRWRVRRSLDGLHVHGLHHARAALDQGSVVFACTHVAWWDGVLMVVLDGALHTDARFVMDAGNLQQLSMFRAIGAIGLDRSSAARSRRGLAEARAHLTGPGSAVWIYPQGRQRPRSVRPLGLHRGVLALPPRSGCTLVPVTLNYGFRESHMPAAVVTFEPPLPSGATLEDLEAALVAGIERADRFLDGDTEGFDTLIPSRHRTIQGGLGARLLQWTSRE